MKIIQIVGIGIAIAIGIEAGFDTDSDTDADARVEWLASFSRTRVCPGCMGDCEEGEGMIRVKIQAEHNSTAGRVPDVQAEVQ